MVCSVVFSPDGASVLTAAEGRTAMLWEARTGACICIFMGHEDMVWSAVVSPDGASALTAAEDTSGSLDNIV
jgi:WD40 repeat protein